MLPRNPIKRPEGRVLMLKLATGPWPATDLSSQSQLSVPAGAKPAGQPAVRKTSTRIEINLEGKNLARKFG